MKPSNGSTGAIGPIVRGPAGPESSSGPDLAANQILREPPAALEIQLRLSLASRLNVQVFFCKCLLPCYFDQSTCYWLPLPGLVTHSLTHSLGLIDVTLADDSAYSKTVFVLADVEVGGWESIRDGRATA